MSIFAGCAKKWKTTLTIPLSSKPCAARATCSKAKGHPQNRSRGDLPVSPFWRPAIICLALVAAILIAVQWVSPGTLSKIWLVLLVCVCVAAVVLYLSHRSVSLRLRRMKAVAERAAAGDFVPVERDPGHDELAELAAALRRAVTGLGQTIHSLTDERNRSSAILGSMVEGVAVVAGDERI